MSRALLVRSAAMVLFAMCAVVPRAGAQGNDDATGRRPFRGLFGAGDAPRADRPSMTLVLSAFGAYDDRLQNTDLAARKRSGVDPGLQGALRYRRPGRRVELAWTADAYARRYAVADEAVAATGESAIALSMTLTRRLSIRLGQRLSYAPPLLFTAGSGFQETVDRGQEMPVDRVGYLMAEALVSGDATAGLTYAIADGSAVTLEYGHHRATGLDGRSFDVAGHRIGGRFTRRIARNVSARAGYAFQLAEHNTGGVRREVQIHDIDAGVDYRRSISLTRRTRLNVSTGSALVGTDEPTAVDAARTRLHVRALGTVELAREFGRTWSTRVWYDRGVQFSDRIAAPALTDTVGLSAAGFFGRRVRTDVVATFTIGQVGVGADADPYESLTAFSQLQYALTRRWALFADYSLYAFRFATAAHVPSWLPGRRRHSSARAGLTWHVPVLR